MQIFAEEICYKLQDILKAKREIEGTVHSVFNRVCNINFDKLSIVSLLLKNIPIKPMAISLNSLANISMHELGIEAGQDVKYYHNKLEIPKANLIVNLDDSKRIDCSPSFDFKKLSINQVNTNIYKLRLVLDKGNPMGILPVISNFEKVIGEYNKAIIQNSYSKFAWPRISRLISHILKGNIDEIVSASRGIAGFGPGLTPSSDDMLIGLMISLIYASNYYNWESGQAQIINSAILKGAEGRTNQLSYEMMSYAAQGEVIKDIHELMSCIYFTSSNSLYQSAMDVMHYGETSGADLLSGIYIGCKICSLNEEVKSNLIMNK